MKTGIELIADERQRQREDEGFDETHDDKHVHEELALAAVCYITPEPLLIRDPYQGAMEVIFRDPWPWSWSRIWDKRKCNLLGDKLRPGLRTNEEKIKDLVKGAALAAAEIDRLLRLCK